MRILVTGSNGLVGKNFIEHIPYVDSELICPSRAELDLLDPLAVRDYLKDKKPDLIIHAAGRVGGIHANMKEPVRFLLENLDMGRNVVWGARQEGVRRLINLGSSCMYPRNAANPLEEESILTGELEPTNEGYALAKISVARLCSYITRETPEYQYKTLIPCNVYGRWDKFDPSHSHLVASIIHKVHQSKVTGLSEVDIWGDGCSRREFIYAADLADCLWHAVRNFDSMPALLNVGPGTDYTINEYYQAAAEVIGFDGKFVHDLTKPVGMKQKLVSVAKLSSWGWQAQTSLRDGLAATYRFYLTELEQSGGIYR